MRNRVWPAAVGKPFNLAALLVLAVAAMLPGRAAAVDLPDQPAMESSLAEAAVVVEVVEPHLSTADRPVPVQYRGWPAERVLDRRLGQAWRAPGAEIEFRALDGYVSHIPVERFLQYRAYLVFERPGHPTFSVDNRLQNEKNVALGPWYLVWDNLRNPELRVEGGTFWPYQIKQLSLATARLDALLPAGTAAQHAQTAGLAQKYCLSCHQVNGYGGDKWPINLAERVKSLSRPAFLQWVLHPDLARPGTSMPGLPDTMPADQRAALADKLYDYLMAVPVVR